MVFYLFLGIIGINFVEFFFGVYLGVGDLDSEVFGNFLIGGLI